MLVVTTLDHCVLDSQIRKLSAMLVIGLSDKKVLSQRMIKGRKTMYAKETLEAKL